MKQYFLPLYFVCMPSISTTAELTAAKKPKFAESSSSSQQVPTQNKTATPLSLTESLPTSTEDHFALYAGSLPESIREINTAWKEPLETYTKLNVKQPRTALVYGPEGVGKTLLIDCIAKNLGARLVTISRMRHLEKLLDFADDTQNPTLQEALAREISALEDYQEGERIILYIPNIEALSKLSVASGSCPYNLLNGLVKNSNNFFLAAETNKEVHPSVLKKFDSLASIPHPDNQSNRSAILNYYLKQTTAPKDVSAHDIRRLVAPRLLGMTGADIEKIVAQCALKAHLTQKSITAEHLTKTINTYSSLVTNTLDQATLTDYNPLVS